MRQTKFVLGSLTLEITSGDCVSLLNACKELRLREVTYCDDLTLRVTVNRNDYQKLLEFTERQGASVKILRKNGIYWTAQSILKRPVLIIFIAVLLTLALFLPSRILFVSVEGNLSVPSNEILEAASQCGIRFGATRRQVRSEKMKNALLQKIPKLQWAGINTSGCTAVISVKEKTTQETKEETGKYVSSIVASRDGIIQNCTVYKGNPLCSVGQAVKAGETLVSGYQDCGIMIKATQASAEIKALTFRELELISPAPTTVRGVRTGEKRKYSLRIGKKLIKFYKDSGNLDTTCGKIYSEEYVQLPGGFVLPIAIVRQTNYYFDAFQEMQTLQDQQDWLADFATSYLQSTMIAGEILSAQTEMDSAEDVCRLYGKYACMEMIGQVKHEQMIEKGDRND